MSRHNVTYKPGGSIAKPLDLALKLQRVLPVVKAQQPPVPITEPPPPPTPECTVNASSRWFIPQGEDPNISDFSDAVSADEASIFAFMAGLAGEYCPCSHPEWDESDMGAWVTWSLNLVSGTPFYGFVGMFVDKDTALVYSTNAPGPGQTQYELVASVGGVALPPITLTIFPSV